MLFNTLFFNYFYECTTSKPSFEIENDTIISDASCWWSDLTSFAAQNGFWGIERHPVGGLRAISRRGPQPFGRLCRVVAGRRRGSDFLFVDGELVAQVDDPAAPRRASSRAALAT